MPGTKTYLGLLPVLALHLLSTAPLALANWVVSALWRLGKNRSFFSSTSMRIAEPGVNPEPRIVKSFSTPTTVGVTRMNGAAVVAGSPAGPIGPLGPTG